jgi:hypothetical protein
MELDVAVAVLVDACGSCCVCHVLSVERGTDIIGSIHRRVGISRIRAAANTEQKPDGRYC